MSDEEREDVAATEDAEDNSILPHALEEEMKTSYMNYAMSVIVSRALPDIRDGLKPVHRRVLYAMNEMGSTHGKPYKKSASTVGEVLGKYHPHGDSSIYDTLVRMAQDFSLRYPLIDGQGNFGSVDGDPAAAMRYTESRMSKIADEMLADIDKDSVDFADNFDGTLKEPEALPARLPNLLVNGSSGIAVGMATNMPPHNLSEVCDAITATIENPEISLLELMDYIKGPDFPTGGIIYGLGGIQSAYLTGRGSIKIRARADIEEKVRKRAIIVTEIPYMVNKAKLITHIADLVRDKTIEGISDLRDESDRRGMRIVIELKQDANAEIVLNQLFSKTEMESTFGVNNLALVDGKPRVLPLKDMLTLYTENRVTVTRRRIQFDLEKAKKREHILQGLVIALNNIDDVIEKIRAAANAADAKSVLMAAYPLSEEQTAAILDMRLQKLTGMEVSDTKQEAEELRRHIVKLEETLGSNDAILAIIKSELADLKEKYADDRRSEISTEVIDIEIEDLIPRENVVVAITHDGYIKRMPIDTYRSQRRGGRGLMGMGTKDDDFVEDLFVTNTHHHLLFFTSMGKVHWMKGYHIPVGSRQSKGKPIINLLPRLEDGEKIYEAIPIAEFDDEHFVVFATKQGVVKRTVLSAYGKPRAGGIRAVELREGDELIGVGISGGEHKIVLATRNGLSVKFQEDRVRAMGRTATGVKGITLGGDDAVVSMTLLAPDEEADLLTITEQGYGKRTAASEYRLTNRGAKGVRTIVVNERNGRVVTVKKVDEQDELILISVNGMVIRIKTSDVSRIGRNTQGNRIMRLKPDDRLIAVARLIRDEESEDEDGSDGENDGTPEEQEEQNE